MEHQPQHGTSQGSGMDGRGSSHHSSVRSNSSTRRRGSAPGQLMRRASTGNVKAEVHQRLHSSDLGRRSLHQSLSASTHHLRRSSLGINSKISGSAHRRSVTFQSHNDTSAYASGHSRRSEYSRSTSITSLGEENRGGSPESPKQQRKRSLLDNLTHVPSQSAWEEPVTVKHPKSVVRIIRLMCGKIVEMPNVQLTIIILIIVNAIIMGIATFDFVTDNPKVLKTFEQVDKVFLTIFTLELLLQVIYRSLGLFMDGWLVFDFVIVVISWSLESLQIVRAFRIFRAFRLITRVGPLRELVMAIGTVLPRIYAIAMLLLLIFYIYGVLFTELFGDLVLSDNYFGSLDTALFTCMQFMTMEWAAVCREVMEHKSYAWVLFLSFISITGFIVFNLVIAVVCDAVSVVEQQMKGEGEEEEEEDDATKLIRAQERIWELTGFIEEMNERQENMQLLVARLASQLQPNHPPPRGILKKPKDGNGDGGNGDKGLDSSDGSKNVDKSNRYDQSFSGSFSSFFSDSHSVLHQSSCTMDDFINSSNHSNEDDALLFEKSAPISPRRSRSEPGIRIQEGENESESEGDWQKNREAEAFARSALASRGYLNPRLMHQPSTSSETLQTEGSSSTTLGEAAGSGSRKQGGKTKTAKRAGSGKSLSPEMPVKIDRSEAPMKSLFSP